LDFSYIFNHFFEQPTVATKSIEPVNVKFTNITDAGFSVTWITGDQTTGVIILSGSDLKTQNPV